MKVKKLNEHAVLPKYANPCDAGLDLTATSIEYYTGYIEYGTGLAVEIPENHVGLLFPRSSVTGKDLMLKNSVGVIDSSYRGEVKVRFQRLQGVKSFVYSVGERVAQLVIVPYRQVDIEEVKDLSTTERGIGGFGSSGK